MSMSHSEVAHNWAHDNYNRNGELNGGNVYATEHNRTIYSYGPHFPIARKTNNPEFTVFFTYKGYSNSTAKHIGYVRYAISHYRHVFYCSCPGDSEQSIYSYEMRNHLPDLARQWVTACRKVKELEERIAKREAKRLPVSEYLDEQLDSRTGERDHLLTQIRDRAQELERFRIAFDLKVKDQSAEVKLLRKKFLADNWQRVTEQQAAAARRKAKRDAAEAEAHRKRLEAEQAENRERWLKGEDVRLAYYGGAAQIRVKNGEVQTTQGARVPVEEAAEAVRFIDLVMEKRGGEWRPNGERHSIGGFDISSITKDGVVVGCHRFTHEEIERVKPQILSHHYSQQEEEVPS